MPITSTTKKVTALGNSSATVFSFSPVVIPDADSLQVVKTSAAGVETVIVRGTGATNYSVAVTTYPGTGSITYPASGGTPLATGDKLTIKRLVPITQTVDLNNQGGYFADVQEGAMDKATMVDLQQQDDIDRSVKIPVSDSQAMQLPTAVLRALKFLAFDANGAAVAAAGTSADLTPVSTFMNSVLSTADAAAFRIFFGLGNIDLSAFDGIFTVTDAENPWSGDSSTDTSWMNGLWITRGLYWDDTYKMLSRVEASKNTKITGICILPVFPDSTATFGGICEFRIQGTSAMTGAGNTPGVGIPDRLVWPAAGSVGGFEMVDLSTDEGQKAAGGSVQEMDGDGSTAGFARRVFKLLLDDGTFQTWGVFPGQTNAYADSGGLLQSTAADVAAASSIRDGYIYTINKTSKVVSNVRKVIDFGAASAGAVTWTRIYDRKLSSGVSPIGGRVFHARDQKTANTAGGTFTSGAWQKRDMGTEVTNEIESASLASSQITLPAGTYEIDAWAIGNNVGANKLRLYNTTGTADLIVGSSGANGAASNMIAVLKGRFALATTSVLELQHRCTSTQATTGFGSAANLDSKVEVYAEVIIHEVIGG